MVGERPPSTWPRTAWRSAVAAKLSTIRKVDDFPLCWVDYEANYRLHELLRRPPLSDEEARRFYMETARKLSGEEVAPTLPPSAGLSWPRGTAVFATLPDGKRVLARSLAWTKRPVFLVRTSPMNAFASVSMVDSGSSNPFGYKTLGQAAMLAPYAPLDGLNDRGFAVCLNALPAEEPPADPEKGNIGLLQAIRLLLDYASSVPHAVQLLDRYNVRPMPFAGHYLMADASGRSAVVDFHGGKMRVLDVDRPWNALGTFPIQEGLPRRGKEPCMDRMMDSLDASSGSLAREEIFKGLGVAHGKLPVLWTSVYDLNTRELRVSVGGITGRVYRFGMS